jgi:hypothetical protein
MSTWQYFFIWARSFSISFLPKSSFHFRHDLVNAFFFDWDLHGGDVKRPSHVTTPRGDRRGKKRRLGQDHNLGRFIATPIVHGEGIVCTRGNLTFIARPFRFETICGQSERKLTGSLSG